jgi:hypothetical protein
VVILRAITGKGVLDRVARMVLWMIGRSAIVMA